IGVQGAAAGAGTGVAATVALEAVLVVVVPRSSDVPVLGDRVLRADPGDLQYLVFRGIRIIVDYAEIVATQPGERIGDRQRGVFVLDVLVAARKLERIPGVARGQGVRRIVGDRGGQRIGRGAGGDLRRAERRGGDRVLLVRKQTVNRKT